MTRSGVGLLSEEAGEVVDLRHRLHQVTVAPILEQMTTVARPGLQDLDPQTKSCLQVLTSQLVSLREPFGIQEFERFHAIRRRELQIPDVALGSMLADRTVLVTGGTGCIGSILIAELRRLGARRIVSLSRGRTVPPVVQTGVSYRFCDIADPAALRSVLLEVRPNVIFHLAAQHDPSLAELEVSRTLQTNLYGTRNVVELAAATGVEAVIYASTGKAQRPFTADVYAATKKAGEWLLAQASGGNMRVAAARFTHVVDNSIIAARLRHWILSGEPVRLHGTDVYFYLQSAIEATQLLLSAYVCADRQALPVLAMRDLGMPASLLDLAVGFVSSLQRPAAVYFSGFSAGYEEHSFPGLYDPRSAGEVSPLINALEARRTSPLATVPTVDCFQVGRRADEKPAEKIADLEELCRADDAEPLLRVALEEISWDMLRSELRDETTAALRRASELAMKLGCGPGLTDQHRRTVLAIRSELLARTRNGEWAEHS